MKYSIYSLITISVLFVQCQQNKPVKQDEKQTNFVKAGKIDTPILDDANFVFHDLDNKLISAAFVDDDHLYFDSTRKIKFIELTKAQKVKLLAPLVTKEIEVSTDYVRDWQQAYFISKPQPINGVQCVLVKVSGDDYDPLKLISLDKNSNPIDAINIKGGMMSFEPEYDPNDSTIIKYLYKDYSQIKNNLIIRHKIFRTERTDIDSLISDDDQITESYIDKNGKFITKESD